MNKYVESEMKLRDAARVEAIRAEAANRIAQDFANVKKRAAENAAAMNSLRGFRAAW